MSGLPQTRKQYKINNEQAGKRIDNTTTDEDGSVSTSMVGDLEIPKQPETQNITISKPIDVEATQRANFRDTSNAIVSNSKQFTTGRKQLIPAESGSISTNPNSINQTPIATGNLEVTKINASGPVIDASKRTIQTYSSTLHTGQITSLDELYLTNDERPLGLSDNVTDGQYRKGGYEHIIKVSKLYRGTNQIEQEQILLEDLATFRPRVGYTSIFKYEAQVIERYRMQSLTVRPEFKPFMLSREFLPVGTALLTRVWNTDFLNNIKVPHKHGMPYLTGVIAQGYNQAEPLLGAELTIQGLLAAKMLFSLRMMNYNELTYTDNNSVFYFGNVLDDPYADTFQNTVILPENFSILKAAYKNEFVPWLNTEVEQMLQNNQITYTNGKVYETIATEGYKMYSTYGTDDIDQYTASILNYNAKEFLNLDVSKEYFMKLIAANSLPNATILIDQGLNLNRIDIEPVDQILRNLVYSLTINQSLYDYIQGGAYTTILDYNLLTQRPTPQTILHEQCDPVTATGLNKAHKNIESAIDKTFDMNELLAMEIVPPIRMLTMHIPYLSFDPYEFAMRLVSIAYASEYIPNTFMRVIGFIQNWFFQMLHNMNGGVQEYTTLMGRYGLIYRENKNDNTMEFARPHKGWTNELYSDRWLPILHGLTYFPREFNVEQLPLIQKFLSICRNIAGNWRDDTRGMRVYPRIMLAPKHFYPCDFSMSRDLSVGLNSAFIVKQDYIIALLKKMKEGPTSKNTIKSNLYAAVRYQLGDYTRDNNFGMHTSGILIMDVLANGPYAIFKPRAEDKYEIPYQQLCSQTLNENNRLEIVKSGDYDIESNVDFSIFWEFFSNYAFSTIIRDNNQIERGIPSNIMIKTLPQAVSNTIKNSTNLFRGIRLMSEIRGFVSWFGAEMATYDVNAYRHINDLGETESTLYAIDEMTFKVKLQGLMSCMGLIDQDNELMLLTIRQNTTLEELNAQLEITSNPRLVKVEAIGSDAIRNTLIDQNILLYVNDYQIILDNWPQDYFEPPIEIQQQYNTLIPHEFHGIKLKSRLDPGNIMKTFSRSMLRKISTRLMEEEDIDGSGEGMITFWKEIALKRDYSLGLTFIRRIEGGRALPYVDGIDNPAFKSSKFFIDERSAMKLDLAIKAIENETYRGINTGIVFAREVANDTFDHIQPLDTTDYEIINYSDDMIRPMAYDPTNTKAPRYGLYIDGEVKRWDNINKKIYFRIRQEQLMPHEVSFIVLGFNAYKVAIEITDLKYTYEVINMPDDTFDVQNYLSMNALTKNLVHQFKFFDNIGYPRNTKDQPFVHYDTYRNVFPLQPLDKCVAIRNLNTVQQVNKPDTTITNFKYDIDTGMRIGMGEDLKYTDGTTKVDDKTSMSFTNYMHFFTANIKQEPTIRYQLIDPVIDEDTSFN